MTDSTGWRGGEHQVSLLLRSLQSAYFNILAAPAASRLSGEQGMSVLHVPLRCAGLLDFRSVFAVRRLIARHGIRLIHAHTSHAQEVAILAGLGLHLPIIVSRRTAFPVSGGWKYRVPARFVAVSQAAAEELRKGGVKAERITIIPDSIDLPGHAAAVPDRAGVPVGALLVLCVAALSEEKDHPTLLRAWRSVEAQRSDAHLALLGDGPLRPQLETLAATLGLRRLIWLGDRANVLDYIHGSDLVVLTSRCEGLGSALCEAQAAGRAVVATRTGGIPEAIEEGVTGLLATPHSSDEVAAALLTLLGEPSLRLRYGKAGRERALRLFDPVRTSSAYAAIYRAELASMS